MSATREKFANQVDKASPEPSIPEIRALTASSLNSRVNFRLSMTTSWFHKNTKLGEFKTRCRPFLSLATRLVTVTEISVPV